MPTLYNADLSPYAARVRLAVYWKGLEEEIAFEAPPGGLKSKAYLEENPLGKVPALKLDDGFCLPESELILEYIEDSHPERALRPADAKSAALARLCARLADLYLAPGLAPLFLNADPSKRDSEAVEAGFESVAKALGHIERYLHEDGPFALGGAPSTADCALAPVFWFINWADAWYERSVLAGHPKCRRVFDAVGADAAGAKVFGELDAGLKARFGG
ncbi:MAG: glutathione S-transferase family protein [Oceanicaulis sp.]